MADDIFRDTNPPPPPRPKKVSGVKASIHKRMREKKRATALRKKAKREETQRHREVARQATKMAIEQVAEETFGEGGLTLARQEALSAVLVGPDGGQIIPHSPQHLKQLVRKAREKFIQMADQYMDVHLKSTKLALSSGEFDTAARHAEWMMDKMGSDGERLVETTPKAVTVVGGQQAGQIMVGVNLGGVPQPQKS